MIRIAGITLLVLTGSAAGAEEFPRFDIKAMCRAAPDIDGSRQSTDLDCVRDETEARTQLQQQWTSFDPRQRSMCVEQSSIGGYPSYVDVITCLQLAAGQTPTASTRRARPN